MPIAREGDISFTRFKAVIGKHAEIAKDLDGARNAVAKG
jgi:hypothetical protein